MPELPEVETTRRGIRPLLVGRRVEAVVVRQRQLRWRIPEALDNNLPGHTVRDVRRRAKYLLLDTEPAATVLLHLGMSGRLRVIPSATPAAKHDHLDFVLDGGDVLRLTDPRRFGACLWIPADGPPHPLLRHLGVEPLSAALTGDYLYRVAHRRRVAVKNLLMNASVVCGVGNIYANEALFRARIHPLRAAGNISLRRYAALVEAVRTVLGEAIAAGGTTLRDYRDAAGNPGYFVTSLAVYGRGGQPCLRCAAKLKQVRITARSTCYCPRCQR
ncbi:MAG: bifunctional DNA-formamidopyrimidine glycosylase/DNA-(apurinic or apyrimidinic site) lyase [Spirochaetaceae bacterium]|nr:bifunctional DNA-formamidopyrimidine glycosylase/DNA-(apurinic or apyrimidinic site) lyase [Spirochaetaceae bacterium]